VNRTIINITVNDEKFKVELLHGKDLLNNSCYCKDVSTLRWRKMDFKGAPSPQMTVEELVKHFPNFYVFFARRYVNPKKKIG